MLRLLCPCCGGRLNVEERLLGQDVRCPKCLSTMPVTRPKAEDLATIIEPSYEPVPSDEDAPQPGDCPKCGQRLAAGQTLCAKCGYHTKLEGYFEDLTEEALTRDQQPKTRAERWLDSQLDERATRQDVLWASAFCVLFCVVALVVLGRIGLGPWLGTFLGLLLGAGLGYGWFMLMRYLGAIADPKREERLRQEARDRQGQVRRGTVSTSTVKEKGTQALNRPIVSKPIRQSEAAPGARQNGEGETTGKITIDINDDDWNAEDVDLFDEPLEEAPKTPRSAEKTKLRDSDDRWLQDLL